MPFFNIQDKTKKQMNITSGKYEKIIQVKGQQVHIDFLDAKYANIDGKQVPLDEEILSLMSNKIAGVLSQSHSRYVPIPERISILNEQKKEIKSNDYLTTEPRYTLDQIYLPSNVKKQITTVLTMEKHKVKLQQEWGLSTILKDGRAMVLNFYGAPGTGKSMTAEAIADYLGKKVMNVNYAQLESKYVGETPKNIQKCFLEATEHDAVLIFDEADSFLGKRLTHVNQSADYGVNVTRSVMLMELERFTGVVIFTTNLMSNYDDAFRRRILANIEFEKPDVSGRERIWESHLPNTLPLDKTISPKILSAKFEHITGADIKDIVLYASINCLERNEEILSLDDFNEAYTYVISRYQSAHRYSLNNEVITQEQYEIEMKQLEEGK